MRDVTRSRKKKAAGRVQAAVDLRANDLQVRFLNHIIDVSQRREFLSEIRPKNRFVRLHFLGEPTASFRFKRWHDRNCRPATRSLNPKN